MNIDIDTKIATKGMSIFCVGVCNLYQLLTDINMPMMIAKGIIARYRYSIKVKNKSIYLDCNTNLSNTGTMDNLEYLSDFRKKRIHKDVDKQLLKHLELLCINTELQLITGSTTQKLQLIESIRKINDQYLV